MKNRYKLLLILAIIGAFHIVNSLRPMFPAGYTQEGEVRAQVQQVCFDPYKIRRQIIPEFTDFPLQEYEVVYIVTEGEPYDDLIDQTR